MHSAGHTEITIADAESTPDLCLLLGAQPWYVLRLFVDRCDNSTIPPSDIFAIWGVRWQYHIVELSVRDPLTLDLIMYRGRLDRGRIGDQNVPKLYHNRLIVQCHCIHTVNI